MAVNDNIENQLSQIADRLAWINPFDKTVNQLEIAKSKFLTLSECLVIFDNVESLSEIYPYLPKNTIQSHILITSREKVSGFRQLELELLNRKESRELLLRVAKRNTFGAEEAKWLNNILEMLGDIPLAIELVGGYLAEHENVTFENYYQYLNNVSLDELEKAFPDSSFTKHDISIIRTLQISEKLLKEKPLMVDILRVLAWSGASLMSLSLLQSLVKPKTDFEFSTALGDALNLRILKKDEGAERYGIHRMLAKVLRHQHSLSKRRKWHEKINNNLISWFSKRRNDFAFLTEFEAEIEHLREWQSHANKLMPSLFVRLITLESYPSWHRGNYKKALQILEKSFEMYELNNLDDKTLLADIKNMLGVIYSPLGQNKKALKYSNEALKIRQKLLGIDSEHTVSSLANVGIAYNGLNKFDEALKCHQQVLESRIKSLGSNHGNTAAALNNVGIAHLRLDNPSEALKYFRQASKIYKKIFGEKHPYTAGANNNIAISYRDLGKYKISLKYLISALSIYQELLSNQHPTTIMFAKNLINIYLKLENREKAKELADAFLSYVPQTNKYRTIFEQNSSTNQDSE